MNTGFSCTQHSLAGHPQRDGLYTTTGFSPYTDIDPFTLILSGRQISRDAGLLLLRLNNYNITPVLGLFD